MENKIIKRYTISLNRKQVVGDFYLYRNEVNYEVIKESDDHYVLFNEENKERNYVVYKDENSKNEYVLNQLRIDELSDYRISFSFWVADFYNANLLTKKAKEILSKKLTKKLLRAKEQLDALDLIDVYE